MTRFVACLAVAAALALAVPAAPVQAAAEGGKSGRLSANQFVILEPFIVPMTPNGQERRQFTLLIALELADQDDREYVIGRLPKIRSRMYDLLFRLIAYREQEPLVPNTGLIKKKLYEIANNVVGGKKIESIVVQQVYHGRAP